MTEQWILERIRAANAIAYRTSGKPGRTKKRPFDVAPRKRRKGKRAA